MPDTVRQVNCCETCCKDSVTIFLCPTIVCAQTHGPYQHTKCFRKFEAYSDLSDSFSRKPAEQARCATLHSATGCARAHRCHDSRSLFANYKGMRCHVPQTLPLGRSHNRDEAHQVTEKPINDAKYRS